MIKWLCLSLFLLGCLSQERKKNDFSYRVKEMFVFNQAFFLNEKYLEKEISRPGNIWIDLGGAKRDGKWGCINFRIPFEKVYTEVLILKEDRTYFNPMFPMTSLQVLEPIHFYFFLFLVD